MTTTHEWIQAHIPHQGNMCLLNHVVQWDETNLHATAVSHLHSDNPLRTHARLSAASGIEYAAQAMAIHAALQSGSGTCTDIHTRIEAPPRAGLLASVRNTTLHVMRLDDQATPLHIHITRLHGDASGILYQFNMRSANGKPLLEGRATIIFQEPA